MSVLERSLLKRPGGLPPVSNSVSSRRRLSRDFSPQTWHLYFDSSEDVKLAGGDVFHVYRRGSEGPLLVLLHGGGFSGLSWCLTARQITSAVKCQVVAIDLRGHGESSTSDELGLSMEKMTQDVQSVLSQLFGDSVPVSILVGHSMGGALATRAAQHWTVGSLGGLVVIDVVEGSAVEALSSMNSYLRGRPSKFRSIEQAVEWSMRSSLVRNLESARVSVPGHLKLCGTDEPATKLLKNSMKDTACSPNPSILMPTPSSLHALEEKDEESVTACESGNDRVSAVSSNLLSAGDSERCGGGSQSVSEQQYTWRIDLAATQQHWSDWFSGLSDLFLSAPAPKLLLLASVDRLDRQLTVAQMQGKFQMQVLPKAGHAVHEDNPDHVTSALARFLVRNKLAEELSLS